MRNGYRLVRLENQRNCQRDKTSTVLTVEYHDGTVNLFHGCSPRQQRALPPLKTPEEFEFCIMPITSAWFSFGFFSLPNRSLYPSSRSRRGCQISLSPSFRA